MNQKLLFDTIQPRIPFKIRNTIINETGKDITDYPKSKLFGVIEHFLTKDQIHNLINSHKIRANFDNHGIGVHGNTRGYFNAFQSGFDKTGLKAYYQFDSFYLPTATFTDDFSSATGWTFSGSTWGISGGKMNATAVAGNSSDRGYKSLGTTLSNTIWTMDFDYKIVSVSADDGILQVLLTDGTSAPADSLDAIGMSFAREAPSSANRIRAQAYDGGSRVESSTIAYTSNTQEYARIERISATLIRQNAFSDSTRHTPLSGSPITRAINSTTQGLTTLMFASGIGTASTMTAEFDNVAVYDAVNPVLQNKATAAGSGDSLGTAADGILNGVLSVVAGKIDNAYSFDGSTAYCDIGTSLSQLNFLHNTTALWSVNFWLKKAAGTPAAIYSILGVHKDNNASGTGLDLNISTNRRVVCYISSGSASVIDNTGAGLLTSNDTNWHMITCRYDQSLGSANFKAREDNGADTSNDKSGNSPSNSNVSQVPRIGNNQSTYYLNGSLDEMSIWNRVLTDAEITALYNSGNGLALV